MLIHFHGNKNEGFFIHGESTALERLEPCPFCGSKDIRVSNTHTNHYWGECLDCGAQSGGAGNEITGRKNGLFGTKATAEKHHRESFAMAVKQWNTRATE